MWALLGGGGGRSAVWCACACVCVCVCVCKCNQHYPDGTYGESALGPVPSAWKVWSLVGDSTDFHSSLHSCLGTCFYISSGPQLNLYSVTWWPISCVSPPRQGQGPSAQAILEHRRCDKQEGLGLLRTTGREISFRALPWTTGAFSTSQPTSLELLAQFLFHKETRK